jgi:hypothetical protein
VAAAQQVQRAQAQVVQAVLVISLQVAQEQLVLE